MTVQEQAYTLIRQLPEESINAIVRIMVLMLPKERDTNDASAKVGDILSPKMKAYQRMQELRKITAAYDLSMLQRSEALEEKYGKLA
ncbi:MAG: hypothetical protein IK127_05625 [Clostridia bacterium]|nr:hypothetical protein [Clostridia bacterium]